MSPGSAVTTHVLDTVTGEPASGVVVRLERLGDTGLGKTSAGRAGRAGRDRDSGAEIGRGVTNADGRITDLGPAVLAAGTYRLVFETAAYLSTAHPSEPPFFPEVIVTIAADGHRPHYHVPLLLSRYSYTTYRGS